VESLIVAVLFARAGIRGRLFFSDGWTIAGGRAGVAGNKLYQEDCKKGPMSLVGDAHVPKRPSLLRPFAAKTGQD